MNSKIKFETVKADYSFENAGADYLVDRYACLADDFSAIFDSVLERVLKEIGIECVAYVAIPPPPNPSMKRQVIGHDRELLGEVWVQWLDPRSDKREITVKGRYRAKVTCFPY